MSDIQLCTADVAKLDGTLCGCSRLSGRRHALGHACVRPPGGLDKATRHADCHHHLAHTHKGTAGPSRCLPPAAADPAARVQAAGGPGSTPGQWAGDTHVCPETSLPCMPGAATPAVVGACSAGWPQGLLLGGICSTGPWPAACMQTIRGRGHVQGRAGPWPAACWGALRGRGCRGRTPARKVSMAR